MDRGHIPDPHPLFDIRRTDLIPQRHHKFSNLFHVDHVLVLFVGVGGRGDPAGGSGGPSGLLFGRHFGGLYDFGTTGHLEGALFRHALFIRRNVLWINALEAGLDT